MAKETILIVEDEPFTSMVLEDALKDAGFNVLEITICNKGAMAVAREHNPALALVNVTLWDGDDGIALAEELGEIGIPVMLVSGQVSEAKSARTVAVASMPKPYSGRQIVAGVIYMLAHLRGDDSNPRPDGLEIFDVEPPVFSVEV